jgi:competence protein ComEC
LAGIVVSVAFLAGVLLQDSGAGWAAAVPLLGGAVVAFILVGRGADRALLLLALLTLAFGSWRANDTTPRVDHFVVRVNADRSIDGVVHGLPRREATRVEAQIELRGERRQTITASLPLNPVVKSGDSIRFWAPNTWQKAGPDAVLLPMSSSGGDVFIPAFVLTRSSTATLTRLQIRTNDLLTSSIDRFVPEPAAALTLGILNGDDSGMTEATRQRFQMSGMSHITAVSGWNVALVAGLISLFTRRLAPTSLVTLMAGAGVVWTYAFVVGMGPSVLRAAGMATVFLVARWRGRQGDLVTSLLLTVAVIVALTPAIRFDLGFQLSVAATLGIVLFVEQFPLLPGWQSAFALPLVAQIATAPLQLHHFGSFSLLAPVANLIAAPLVALVMAGGVLTVVAALIHPLLAEIAGAFTWLPARLIVGLAEREPAVTGSSGTLFTLSWSATFVTYSLLVLGYCTWSIRLKLTRVRLRALQVDAGI